MRLLLVTSTGLLLLVAIHVARSATPSEFEPVVDGPVPPIVWQTGADSFSDTQAFFVSDLPSSASLDVPSVARIALPTIQSP